MPNYPIDDEVFTLALTKPLTGLERVRDNSRPLSLDIPCLQPIHAMKGIP